MALRLVADRNIAYAAEAFAPLGDVVTLPSSELTRENVRDADLLLVRSTVKVGPALLDGSRVRFVATATIGTDHLDTAWLDARGIAWASAPGSNADSVLEWWAAALLTVAERRGVALSSLRVGIVGVGAVGGRVERFCRALGPAPLRCDPPRARRESETGFAFSEKGETSFTSLDALLPACDVVTLHVPLARDGADATWHLLDERRLAALAPGAWLVNASRGEVVDGAALERALAGGRPAAALLDVWEGEPSPSPRLVDACALATPHIAGHSLDGKANGTEQIYRAACAFLGATPAWSARAALPPPAMPSLRLDTAGRSDEAIALTALRATYRVEDDDAALRAIAQLPAPERAAAFRRHRDHYPPRRELRAFTVELTPPRPTAARLLTALGANVQR